MKNGYLITYYTGRQWVDQDEVLDYTDAQCLIDTAMELCVCTSIIMHCIDDGEVLYTVELFYLDGMWVHCINNPTMKQDSIVVL